MSEGNEKAFEIIDRRLAALAQLENAIRADQSDWYWKKLREYATALFERAPFRPGDRVRLIKTPVITEEKTPGWVCAKHFLVAGAIGTVRYVDFREGLFNAMVIWDDESYVGYPPGPPIPVEPAGRHLFTHWEGSLERVPVQSESEDRGDK